MKTLLKLNYLTFLLALLGLFVASFLTYEYFTSATIPCHTGGCDTIRLSPFSLFLGVSVPIYGIVGYGLIALNEVLLTTRKIKPLTNRRLRFLLALGGVLFTIYLQYTAIVIIKATCTWCIVSAIIITSIFVLASIDLFKHHELGN